MSGPFKMKGSPAKLGTIQGTAAHASALKNKSLMEKLIPSASTRDKIKGIKRKLGDYKAYTKGFMKELLATKGSTISGGKRPGEKGDQALRARKRGVSPKSFTASEGADNRPLKPSNVGNQGRIKKPTTPPKTAQGKADLLKKVKRNQSAKNKK